MSNHSGLENLSGESPERAETAENRPPLPAQDAMFTPRSEPCDGTQVGTVLPKGMKETAPRTFGRCRRLLPGTVHSAYTYFARAIETGEIKIGRSGSPEARMAHLSWERGEPVELLVELRGGHLERAYHNAFQEHRLYLEWFAPHPDILAEIDRLTQQGRKQGCTPAPALTTNAKEPRHGC